jgi:hypothetical protein
MTMVPLLPGVRHAPYFGGWNFDYLPSVIDPDEETAETSQRLANSVLFVSNAVLWTGCPDRITKRTWLVTFETQSSDDLLHVRMIVGEIVDFCPWTVEVERWRAPLAATPAPIRRNAVSVISGGLVPAGDWTAKFIGISGSEYAITWGSPDTAIPWRQGFTFDAMSVEDPGWLRYFPVYRVKVEKPKMSLTSSHHERHTLTLREI